MRLHQSALTVIVCAATTLALSAPSIAAQQPAPVAERRANPLVVVLATSGINEAENAGLEQRSGILFVADKLIVVRSSPDPKSAVVWTMKPLEVAKILEVQPGWFKLAALEDRGFAQGGVHNLVSGESGLTLAMRISNIIEKTTWPVATRFKMITKDLQIGFTEEQVELALGDPIKTATETTATGKTSTLFYADFVVTLVNGRVTKFVKVS